MDRSISQTALLFSPPRAAFTKRRQKTYLVQATERKASTEIKAIPNNPAKSKHTHTHTGEKHQSTPRKKEEERKKEKKKKRKAHR